MKINVVIPTKLSEKDYVKTEAGALLMKLLKHYPSVGVTVESENSRGLVEIFQEHLDDKNFDYVLFIHDDVLLRDVLTFDVLQKAFEVYDIVGLAGSSYQVYNSLDSTRWDTGSYTRGDWGGFVAHTQNSGNITSNYFGVTPKQVVVIDGLFMGFNSKKFRKLGIKLDPQFKFHHYDLDTSITCYSAGMRLGVVPLFVIHESIGELDEGWKESASLFFKKHYKKTYKV